MLPIDAGALVWLMFALVVLLFAASVVLRCSVIACAKPEFRVIVHRNSKAEGDADQAWLPDDSWLTNEGVKFRTWLVRAQGAAVVLAVSSFLIWSLRSGHLSGIFECRGVFQSGCADAKSPSN